jgi:hypothetical protein
MAPHLLRCQGFAVGDYNFTLGRLEAGVPSTFAQLGSYRNIGNYTENFRKKMGSSINELPTKQEKDDTVMQKARVKLFQPRSARRTRRGVLNLFSFTFMIFVFFVVR